ncbi:hypothetical protein EX895_002293 [Sporisorium graminicola]|uniref:Uncharacterized protein n=1 Tax=Sporisorium graminicola TaxID=280036 RepID=A0A4U7L0G1_9BASI|nr:hypothetical protein EX895_002293 [Sporisorium graminicola]TKY88662.1 hypothetical protein EX895_002293 [Sporisorium graminicola]
MARSTQTSPGPSSAPPTRSAQRRATRPIVVTDTESSCDADESCSSEAGVLAQPSARARLPRFTSVPDHDSDDEVQSTDGIEADLMSEDDAYLADLAQATQVKADVLSQRLKSPGENREKLFAQLLDPGKRSELRMKKFSDFVHPNDRHTLDVSKWESKSFIKKRAKKFVDLYELYLSEVHRPGEQNEQLLEALELYLGDLMDCVDHPKDLTGWNPFSALANLIAAGALIRSPEAVQSCSRLTLGADWSLLSAADEARMGIHMIAKLYKLHYWRKVEIDELLGRWSGKFPRNSTCVICKQDLWEIFLLTTVLAMITYGTKHVDKETASDTSSEGDDGGDDDVDEDEDMRTSDNDDDDDHERDNHQEGQNSDSDEDEGCSLMQHSVDSRLLPLDDSEEPPRAPTDGLQLGQRLLRNYGPNQYVLRIVSMDTFGGAELSNPQLKVCPRCGFRFDGKDLVPGTRAHDILEHAVMIARQQISNLQEVIDLPTS